MLFCTTNAQIRLTEGDMNCVKKALSSRQRAGKKRIVILMRHDTLCVEGLARFSFWNNTLQHVTTAILAGKRPLIATINTNRLCP